jgi:hypothetical protein
MYRVRPLHIVGIIAFVTAIVAGVAAQVRRRTGYAARSSQERHHRKIIVKVNGEILTSRSWSATR